MRWNILKVSLWSLLPLATLASPYESAHQNRHAGLAKRLTGDVELYKRFEQSRWSYFAVGLGACGHYNVGSDFIVALNSAQYDSSHSCSKSIVMTYNGKTATATIMDRCPGCPYGGLDLSQGLFQHFAPTSAGIIYGSWSFAGEGGGPVHKSVWSPPPVEKTTWKPQPTTTWSPAVTSTSIKELPSSVSSSSTTQSTKSSTSTTQTPTSSSQPVVPTPKETVSGLGDFNQIIIGLARVVVGAATN